LAIQTVNDTGTGFEGKQFKFDFENSKLIFVNIFVISKPVFRSKSAKE
jgi:hypothetical protein